LLVTDFCIQGYISYLDEEIVAFECKKQKGIYYTRIVKLSSIIAIEYISDINIKSKDKVKFERVPFSPEDDYDDDYNLDDDDDDDDDPFVKDNL
jgi:hypothetical protein